MLEPMALIKVQNNTLLISLKVMHRLEDTPDSKDLYIEVCRSTILENGNFQIYDGSIGMNREILSRLNNKYYYIDLDGTLAEYRFNGHVSAKDGTTNGQTMEEIRNHIFLKSRPLKSVIKTLKRVKKEGIWICGALISPVELQDKMKWLKENCSDIKFNGYFWFVSEEYWDTFLKYFNWHENVLYKICKDDTYIETQYGVVLKGSKIRMWDWIIEHHFHKLEDAVFIDDTLPYLKYAEEKGVTAYHISSFIN